MPVGERYCLHTINAFEVGDRLVVDLLELDRPVYDQYRLPDLFEDVAEGRPVRLVVDLARGALVERREIAYRRAPDFAAIDPRRAGRPYEDFWMLGISATGRPGRKFFDQLVHARWNGPLDIWQSPPGVYLAGEPAFAADPDSPEGGAVVCPLFDCGRRRDRLRRLRRQRRWPAARWPSYAPARRSIWPSTGSSSRETEPTRIASHCQ